MSKSYFLLSFVLLFNLVSCTDKEEQFHESKISKTEEVFLDSLLTQLTTDKSSEKKADSILAIFDQKGAVSARIGRTYFNLKENNLAKKYFRLAADYFEKEGAKIKNAEQTANLGVLSEVTGQYNDASKYYLDALAVFESENLDLQSSMIYNNLGIVYQQMDEDSISLAYYHKSLDITLHLNRPDLIAKRYNNIGTIQEEFYNQLDSAFYYYTKSFQIAQQDSMIDLLPTIENNIAHIYLLQGELTIADTLLHQSYRHALALEKTPNLSPIYRNLAELYLAQNRNELAIETIQKGILLSKANSNKEVELESIEIMMNALEKTKQFEKAFHQIKAYYQLKEEIKGDKIKKEINRLSFEFNAKENENKIQILSLENHVQERTLWLQWFFIFILILFSIILFSIYKLRQKKNHIKMLTIQKEISSYVREISNLKEHQCHSEEEIKKRIKQWELTEREQNILFCITKGMTNKEIAAQMFVSINTVKTHVKNIYVKLDVRNRTEAAQKAK